MAGHNGFMDSNKSSSYKKWNVTGMLKRLIKKNQIYVFIWPIEYKSVLYHYMIIHGYYNIYTLLRYRAIGVHKSISSQFNSGYRQTLLVIVNITN